MPPPLPTTAAPAAVAKAEAGVATDLPELIAAHQRPLWRYLRLLGAERHEADDLVQDTFVAFACPDVPVFQTVRDVVLDRHMRKQRKMLEH